MEELTALLLSWGLAGLIAAAFTESFCSPILPDLILIPLALANPEQAIIYGVATTVASVLGGIIGYWLGSKLGVSATKRMIPQKYTELVQKYAQENAAWAIFFAALSPIPYKFVSITAGALKIDWKLFMGVSFIGRAKRFLIEGVLIYYFGPAAMETISKFSDEGIIVSVIVLAVCAVLIVTVKKYRKKANVVG